MVKWLLGSWMLAMACAGIGSVQAQTVEYIHTDALGTPVAVTDANRNVIERSEYEPYGALLNRPISDGPGYTGHVMDAATGLTYMQQRYYDPTLGRFLSVDPVTANSGTGANFNRYWYANNNPYKFTDPDGRQARPGDRGAAYVGESVSGVDVNSAASLGMSNIPRSWREPTTTLGKVNVGAVQPVPAKGSVVYKQGVPLGSPEVSNMLRCTANCTGDRVRVTSTSDSHGPTNPHTRRLAADVTTSNPTRVMQCAANCGARFQLNEYARPSANATGGHVHLQLVPGRGGATGPYYPLPTPNQGGE